jgi:outer membrane lipoprotein SlyB
MANQSPPDVVIGMHAFVGERNVNTYFWRRTAAVLAAAASLLVGGCNTPPAYSVSEQPAARVGTVESIQTQTVQNVPSAVGAIGGALIGGGLGSLIGGGTGKTVATVVGAVGGGFVGNELASKDQTLVWNIGVRYDDGTYATVQQTSAPGLRIGDRVRVTSTGIELLRG